MIRPALPADLPVLVDMGARFLRETAYGARVPVNRDALMKTAQWLLNTPTAQMFVAEQAGTPIGMIGLACFPHLYSGELTAYESFWWVEPEHRGVGVKLLKVAARWAKNEGATRLQVVAPTRKVAAFYERLGFGEVEIAYDREL